LVNERYYDRQNTEMLHPCLNAVRRKPRFPPPPPTPPNERAQVFTAMTPCREVVGNRRFGGPFRLHRQGELVALQCLDTEDHGLKLYHREDLVARCTNLHSAGGEERT